ncbi:MULTISPECIES: dihydroorotase [Robiginitalea]|uniref:Dihydroorotase, multifunctional complex type n=1 Tax=Robiginitalea biformata (strain ATCC BAA-864 / DSM 15991 / KCTC 12146 / HTCC2501) TaxID=313596 RepID=A4CLI6_ROBBH|nr:MULTISPECIES: dihydroorotase [Robiginitalea]EAR15735.1 dihydroorotase, multifunctional complex type [Robiginitalea biformata HTCC2501]MDC6354162.1 dihydroorotase [Robiginitalea sp. PM2]MDC6374429.1 dihydroorotase [Robiginitalea sp. SP8]
MSLLIKSAVILDASQPGLNRKKRDLLIEGGRISRIASRIDPPKNCRTLTFPNLHVSPGWFDSSVSFGEPGFEERETISNGLAVAAASGFTGVVLNPNTRPVPDTSGDIVFLKDASRKAVTELYPMGALSMGSRGEDLAELYDMHGAGAVAFSDYKNAVSNPNLLKLALLYTQGFDGLVHSFPQDEHLGRKGQMHEGEVSVRLGLRGIPSLAEELQIVRDLAILEYTGGRLHIPMISTARSAALIGAARKKGLDVTCSVAIHNLAYTEEKLESFDSAYKVLPPLRTKKDRKALQKALAENIIDFVTTDHNPMDIEEKRQEFDRAAYGTLGLESAFGILNKLFGTDRAVDFLCRGRSRFGAPEVLMREGERAVLTLFDPQSTYTLEKDHLGSASKNSMFLGEELQGKAYGVVVGSRTNL